MIVHNKKGFMDESEYSCVYNRWQEYYGADFLDGWIRVQIGPIYRNEEYEVNPISPFYYRFYESRFFQSVHLLRRKENEMYQWITYRERPEPMISVLKSYLLWLKYKVENGEEI